ncbi:MAG: Metallo-beta-lactamase family protein [Candidatus Saccharicenans subterraneus]|uniref:Metallo-beta-lactamase family protein n=1 Tax=Candidatus Saccharicenans subterraneus TaxID=2508984 RepID=A0A3E2BKW6_9BACT|nr:MAG: Metallo-beta-lactamase family protein [Candidatus Saccharicenans subterraneum]
MRDLRSKKITLKGSVRLVAVGMALVLCLTMTAALAFAQQPGSPPPLSIEKIKDNVYIIKGGSGANCFLITGKKTNLLIDAKMTPESFKDMLAEIQKISARPLGMILLTHSDGDHVNGLRGLQEKVKILSHRKTYEEMLPAVEQTPELKDILPTETYEGKMLIDFEGTRLELRNFGPAHTSGDTIIFIPESRVAIAGDLMFYGRDPLIHKHKNGTFYGYLNTLQAMLDYRPEIEIFLSGHAEPAGRQEVAGLIASLKDKEAKIREMMEQGKTLDDIKAAFGVQPPAAGSQVRRPPLVEIIYQEIKEKK